MERGYIVRNKLSRPPTDEQLSEMYAMKVNTILKERPETQRKVTVQISKNVFVLCKPEETGKFRIYKND